MSSTRYQRHQAVCVNRSSLPSQYTTYNQWLPRARNRRPKKRPKFQSPGVSRSPDSQFNTPR
ncbi:hypothetical protein VFPPC_17813 [Pochonia chlamydosporia 170]|uniref:Uncharacterized protein n=1 Tax=Pochonia chlamydosporia 170 TaxID=1380566 RepID=A0A219ARQ1_METCM|nr:hypothetical protein VFPPC_17813 [Pochonia chlamydosporia 170]OWT42994.1 hypothetical protein VFPPC_17813 [Pochonia chlamydosporia 170]